MGHLLSPSGIFRSYLFSPALLEFIGFHLIKNLMSAFISEGTHEEDIVAMTFYADG